MVKLHEIKSLMAIMGTIKSNWKNRNSIKIYQSQIKDLKQHVIQTYWKEGKWHVILQLASLFWQFRLIELVTSNEWMWSYWPPYWAKLDINKRCALSLSTLDGLRRRWHQYYSNETLKMDNSVNSDSATIM